MFKYKLISTQTLARLDEMKAEKVKSYKDYWESQQAFK